MSLSPRSAPPRAAARPARSPRAARALLRSVPASREKPNISADRSSPPAHPRTRPGRLRLPLRLPLLAPFALAVAALVAAAPLLVSAQTAEDPSNVVLVFDVSNSILLSKDRTNVEFAAALEDIADRVKASADELAVGNAEISFVVFGRTAITYPNGCGKLALHENPGAVAKLEACLRAIASEYRKGRTAPVRDRINTVDTDHVAALREAADLLPNQTTRSAVIFFTDGQHDPPGTGRDNENVVQQVAAAFEGQTPLAILPVGLGAGAGRFETELRAIYDAYLRDMQPCEGRAAFSWPTIVFPKAEQAGIAVAQALQEVTCSFTFAPPPTAPPPTPTPPPPPGAPLNVQVLPGDHSMTVKWLGPSEGGDRVTGYVVDCSPDPTRGPIHVEVPVTSTQTEITDLTPGAAMTCSVTALIGDVPGGASAESEAVRILGIPDAPGQPRVEPGDAAARVTVDPVTSGAQPDQYVFECRNAAGAVSTAVGPEAATSAIVTGLPNGDTFTCVAYAENQIGRSDASVASAAFSPCGGVFECAPWTKFATLGLLLLAGAFIGVYAWRRYSRRNRVWVTAQVDGGANRPLGWGPDLGIDLQRDDGGWFASVLPFESSEIKVQYRGRERFLVTSKAGIRDVHQGDPALIRDKAGAMHQLILRRYRQKPQERGTAKAPSPAEAGQGSGLGARLGATPSEGVQPHEAAQPDARGSGGDQPPG